jgi:hypothetical protein
MLVTAYGLFFKRRGSYCPLAFIATSDFAEYGMRQLLDMVRKLQGFCAFESWRDSTLVTTPQTGSMVLMSFHLGIVMLFAFCDIVNPWLKLFSNKATSLHASKNPSETAQTLIRNKSPQAHLIPRKIELHPLFI